VRSPPGVDQDEDLELGAIAAAAELAGVDQDEDLEPGAIAAAAELADVRPPRARPIAAAVEFAAPPDRRLSPPLPTPSISVRYPTSERGVRLPDLDDPIEVRRKRYANPTWCEPSSRARRRDQPRSRGRDGIGHNGGLVPWRNLES
jgi:hypothetical protein